LELIENIKQKNVPIIFNFNDLIFATGSSDYAAKGDVVYLSGDKKIEMRNKLDLADIKIFPSKFLFDEYQKIFNFTSARIIPIGSILPKTIRPLHFGNRLTIGFVGVAGEQKGLKSFFKQINIFGKRINYVVLGVKGSDYENLCQQYNVKEGRDFLRYDFYESNIMELIHQTDIDVIIFPSRIPESYSLTLSHAIQLSMPVIAFDTGAIGQRVKEYKAGWLFKTDKELTELINKIRQNKSILLPKIKHLNKVAVPKFTDTANEYDQIFSSIIKTNNVKMISWASGPMHNLEKIQNILISAGMTNNKSITPYMLNITPYILYDKYQSKIIKLKRAILEIPIIGDVIHMFLKYR
jgi:glycosyltransferase involved in cell wall biosynthesis